MPGKLYLCATPIGNLGDASPRLAETLGSVAVVYAEDTRRSGKLLASLGIEVPLRSFFVGNERRRSADMEAELSRDSNVALITDAGMPAVSDPGPLAVAGARRVGAEVVVIPGPSAVTSAVAGSGMVGGRFVFEGFLARAGKERRRQLERIAAEVDPSVVFLSPHRVPADLAALAEACGAERPVCLAREMTKLHEELWWGTLAEAVDRWSAREPRGEFTAVVGGASPPPADPEEAVAVARRLVAEGRTPSQAAREAAATTGVGRRQIYDALVR